jgi:hypothetical protein
MTVGYADGQHFREEISADALRKGAAQIRAGISLICDELEIAPAVAPSAPSELEEKILDISRYGFLDSVYVSASDDILLVSEDAIYRGLAQALHGQAGVWLQAVLQVAQQSRALDLRRYSQVVSDLASLKHSHVTLNAATLRAIVDQESSAELVKLRAAAFFIGGENADVESHLSVSWEFIVELWRAYPPHPLRFQATSIMLERLVHMFNRLGLLQAAFNRLAALSRRYPELAEYLVAWARGHFLDIRF